MYEILLILFAVIAVLAAAGLIKYGFSVIFLYILIFSAVVITWSVVGILDKKKEKNGSK